MCLKERVQALCKKKGVTAQQAEIDLGLGKGHPEFGSNTPFKQWVRGSNPRQVTKENPRAATVLGFLMFDGGVDLLVTC